MKEKKLGLGIIEVAINKVLKIIIPFVCAPYITRKLGLSNVGIYSFLNSIATYFCIIATLGTYSYGKRTIARNRDNLQERTRLFWEIEIVSLITTIISLLVWGCFLLVTREFSKYFIILSVSIISVIFDISWFWEGLEKYRYLMFANMIAKILGVLSIILFVRQPEDLYKYIIIVVVTELFSNLLSWICIHNYLVKVKISFKNLKVHIKETLFYFIPTVAISLYTVLDKTLLGILAKDSYASGCYEQVTNIINIIKGFSFSAITTAYGVRTSYLFGKNKIEEVKQMIENALDMILFLSLGSIFGIIGIAKEFIIVFLDDNNIEIVRMLCLLSPVILVVGISDCLGGLYYTPVGKRNVSTKFILIGAIINVILDIVLIPMVSAKGAIIASVISEGAIMALYLYGCDGFLKIKTIIQLGWKKFIASFVMGGIIFCIPDFHQNLFLDLITKVLVGIFVYGVCLYGLKDHWFVDFIKGIRKKDNNNI